MQSALRLFAEWYLDRSRRLLFPRRADDDVGRDAVRRQLPAFEKSTADALARAQQAEQEMFGFDSRGAELAGLVPREEQASPRFPPCTAQTCPSGTIFYRPSASLAHR